MPADRRAGGVLGNQRALKATFGEASELRCLLTYTQQERRDCLSWLQLSQIEVVLPAEGNSAPLA